VTLFVLITSITSRLVLDRTPADAGTLRRVSLVVCKQELSKMGGQDVGQVIVEKTDLTNRTTATRCSS